MDPYYDPQKIEPKWQADWEQNGVYRAESAESNSPKPKYYCLNYFPYPSGDGLHVGHLFRDPGHGRCPDGFHQLDGALRTDSPALTASGAFGHIVLERSSIVPIVIT